MPDFEVPEPDAIEQSQPVVDPSPGQVVDDLASDEPLRNQLAERPDTGIEVPEPDALEQAEPATLDDEDGYR